MSAVCLCVFVGAYTTAYPSAGDFMCGYISMSAYVGMAVSLQCVLLCMSRLSVCVFLYAYTSVSNCL